MNVVRLSFVGSLAPNNESIIINYEDLDFNLDLLPNTSYNLNEPVSIHVSLQQKVVLLLEEGKSFPSGSL